MSKLREFTIVGNGKRQGGGFVASRGDTAIAMWRRRTGDQTTPVVAVSATQIARAIVEARTVVAYLKRALGTGDEPVEGGDIIEGTSLRLEHCGFFKPEGEAALVAAEHAARAVARDRRAVEIVRAMVSKLRDPDAEVDRAEFVDFAVSQVVDVAPRVATRARRSPSQRRDGVLPRGNGVWYTADLSAEPWREEVRLSPLPGPRSGHGAVLYRYGTPIVAFVPSEGQVEKVRKRQGTLHITAEMVGRAQVWGFTKDSSG
jgi:hypothetical protein